MSVQVKPVPQAQADEAVALWEHAELTRPWNDPHADFARAAGGAASEVLGAYDDGELVGTVMVGHDGHRGWIYYAAVRDSRRGEGIGRQLVAAAEEWVSSRGVPKLMLMVREDNTAVQDFYVGLGYAPQATVVLGRRLFED